MSMDVRKVKLDFNRTFQYDIPSVQGDTGRSIEFQIMNGSVAEDITGETVKIFGLKPDGFRVFNNAVITDAPNGKCIVDLTAQMLCVAGTVQCTLVRYKNDEKLSSRKFKIEVAESVADDIEIESTSEYLALTEALNITPDFLITTGIGDQFLADDGTYKEIITGGELINQNGGRTLKIWAGTKAQYDALLIKDEDTVYLVEGSSSGGSGSEVIPTTYSITNNLTKCTNNNDSVSVNKNGSYTAEITANDGYNLYSVSVTMGGIIITRDVYSDGNITISNVTGDVVITAVAKSSSSPTVPPTGNTLTYKMKKTCDTHGVISDDDKKIVIEDIPVSTESSNEVTIKYSDNSSIWFTARCFNESGTCLGSVDPANLANPVTGQPLYTRTLQTGTKYIKLIIAMDNRAETIVTEDYIKNKIIVVNDVEYSLVKGQ